jgi:hypothetical protein
MPIESQQEIDPPVAKHALAVKNYDRVAAGPGVMWNYG